MNVRIVIDRDATLEARGAGGSDIVARFAEPTRLYRVIDEEELLSIVRSGVVEGGLFATREERKYGASWAGSLDQLVSWGQYWQKGRLGKNLYVVTVDARDKLFYHMGPKQVAFAPNGPRMQETTLSLSECNTGLGCSTSARFDELELFRVKEGKLVPMTRDDVRVLAAKKPAPRVSLRSLGGPAALGGHILGVSVMVRQDYVDKLWSVVLRDGVAIVAGGKSMKKTIDAAADILGSGLIPSRTLFLNKRDPRLGTLKKGQKIQNLWGDLAVITSVGTSYVSIKEGDNHHDVDQKRFFKDYKVV